MKTRNNENQNWEFPSKIFKIFLVLIMVIYIQYMYLSLSPVVYKINMKKFAEARNTYSQTLYANRGTIYDSSSNTLAINISSYTVIAYLSPSRGGDYVKDKEGTAKALAPIINMDEDYIMNLLNKDVYQVELGPGGRNLSELKKDEIIALDLDGIDFIENSKRYYPNGDFASYILGYAKRNEISDNGKITYSIDGELGLESKYDDILKGKNGYLQYQQDRQGYKIPDTKETRIEAENGSDIYLTIDSNIQRFLESSVKDAAEIYEPDWMLLTVMDAKTGDILGSATYPSFDPNIRDIENYENPLVSYTYEPGSTMKTYTYMCAIDKGTYDGNLTYQSGSIEIGGSIINDWNKVGWGTVTYDLGYEYSSNTAIANVLNRFINKQDLKECFTKYGFGQTTGIELPREFPGNITFNYPIEVVAAGYGQGILTTAVQHLQALTIISNGGKMLKPNIIKEIRNSNNGEIIYQREIKESKQIVKDKTVSKMKELMFNTVNGTNYGTTGSGYKITGFDIIGKTGTAQIYDVDSNRYLTGWNDYIYSFSGIFPNKDPKYIVYGAIQRPNNGSARGLQIATKTALENIAKYKNVFPSDSTEQTINEYILDSYISTNTNKTKDILEANGLNVIVIGDGNKVISQYPYKGIKVVNGDKVFLITNGTNIKIPNMKGWSRNDAELYLKIIEVDYELNGYGYVISQSEKTGTLIEDNMKITILLGDKFQLVDKEKEE